MEGGGSRSFGERIEMREGLIRKACELSMEAHKHSEHYLYESSSSEAVFAFAGSWSVNDWFSRAPFGETEIDLSLFPSLRSIGGQATALVNETFLRKFKAILDVTSLDAEVNKAVNKRKKIVFAGHSSGGPLAILSTLWFLEKYTRKDGNTSPRCVTFGSPLIGDSIFPHAIRRENWEHYFLNFVMRYDIVPLVMLSPFSTIEQELPQILDFFNPKSTFFKHLAISNSREASSFYRNVLIKASSVASYAACNLMGCTNLIVGNFSSFFELSPYRPFGTYIFCTENGKLIVVKNPDAVLQMLFHFSQLSSQEECSTVASRKLNENLVYKNVLQHCLEMQRVVYLDSAADEVMETNKTLDDLGLSAKARLCLRAAEEFEKQKLKNEKKINKESIRKILSTLQDYRSDSERKKVGYYDAFKIQIGENDFKANVARLELAGIWDEIMDMLKRRELPDSFEGNKDWIDLGTEFRRLSEPLDIANYYRHGRNDDAGSYLVNGRPRRYIFPQRWHEHKERMLRFDAISESSFWGEVEELKIISKKESYKDMKERIKRLEGLILHWHESKVLENDVLLDKSTFTQWWKSLPQEHKLESCIRELFPENITDAET